MKCRERCPFPAWLAAALLLLFAACSGDPAAGTDVQLDAAGEVVPGPPLDPPPSWVVDQDITLSSLGIEVGEVLTVLNGATIHVDGDVRVDGTLRSEDGPLHLRVDGSLQVEGQLEAANPSAVAPDADTEDTPLGDQSNGLYAVVQGNLHIGDRARLVTDGPLVLTDDPTILDQTPAERDASFEEIEPGMDTLVPLPPDHPAFDGSGDSSKPSKVLNVVVAPNQIRIGGTSIHVIPSNTPRVLVSFRGNRHMILQNLLIQAPPALPGNQPGRNGRKGMTTFIRNTGKVSFNGVTVFALADGGDGSSETTSCADARGGDGGEPGNFKVTAGGGIAINGLVLIVPGRGGHGGDATANATPAAGGCPGKPGCDVTATGGSGGNNHKRLFAAGNVSGLAGVTIAMMLGGDGGDARAEGGRGGDGDPGCDGGPGGKATAKGGKGGDTSFKLAGAAAGAGVVVRPNRGGVAGYASARGGRGGDGGDLKWGKAGNGGKGGDAHATGGDGGAADNSGGPAIGAFALGGNGGDGGDSAIMPGAPGAEGKGTADGSIGGPGAIPGRNGANVDFDGLPGAPGQLLPIRLLWFFFAALPAGPLAPGLVHGPLADPDGAEIGVIDVEVAVSDEGQLAVGEFGELSIIGPAQIDILVGSIEAEVPLGEVGGVELVPISSNIDPELPLTVTALDAEGEPLGEAVVDELPMNVPGSIELAGSRVAFELAAGPPIDVIRLDVPAFAFLDLLAFVVLDP